MYNKGISDFNLAHIRVNTLEECHAACLAMSGCLGVEYVARDGLCQLSSASRYAIAH